MFAGSFPSAFHVSVFWDAGLACVHPGDGDLIWRGAAGEIRDATYDESAVVSRIIDGVRGDRSKRDLLVASIDPYGNTRFSSGQAARLLREFEMLRTQSESADERIALGRVISILRAAEGTTVVVRRAGRYSSEDIHQALFSKSPKSRKLSELRQAIGAHLRKKHARASGPLNAL